MFPLLPVIQGGLMGHRLEPGDTVFVPEKLVYPNKMKLYSNIAQIFASTAQTLGIFALAAGSVEVHRRARAAGQAISGGIRMISAKCMTAALAVLTIAACSRVSFRFAPLMRRK